MTERYTRREIEAVTRDFRTDLAVQYVKDAIRCRKLQVLPQDLSQRKAARLYNSDAYKIAFFFLLFLLVLIAPMDNDQRFSKQVLDTTNTDFDLLNWVLRGAVFLDMGLGVVALGWRRYFQSRRHLYYLGVWALLLVNDLWWRTHALRAFRAVLIIIKSRGLRATIGGMVRTIPRVWQVLVIYATVTTLYALLAMELLHVYYADLDVEFTNTFNTFPRAWLAMFVLSTTENFPFIMYPPIYRMDSLVSPLHNSSSPAPLSDPGAEAMHDFRVSLVVLFFVSYLLLIVYLILNMKLAAVYDSWKEVHEAKLLEDRVRRYHALIVAHHALVDDGSKEIDLTQWSEIVSRCRPRLMSEQVNQTYYFLDSNCSGGIELREWMLHGVDAINFSFVDYDLAKVEDEVSDLPRDSDVWVQFRESWTPERMRHHLQRLSLRPPAVIRLTLTGGVLLNTTILVVSPWPYPTGLAVVQVFLVLFFVAEQAAHLYALRLHHVRRRSGLFDLVATIALLVVEFFGLASPGRPLDGVLLQIQLGVRAFYMFRLLTLSPQTKDVLETIGRIRELLTLFVIVFFVIIYMYACVAQTLFHNVLTPNFAYDADDPTGPDDDVLGAKVYMGSFGDAFMQLFQIATTNNWQDIMYANLLESGSPAWKQGFIGFYFVSFFMVMVWFGTNVLTALVIDVYVVATTRKKARWLDEKRMRNAERSRSSEEPEGGQSLQRQQKGEEEKGRMINHARSEPQSSFAPREAGPLNQSKKTPWSALQGPTGYSNSWRSPRSDAAESLTTPLVPPARDVATPREEPRGPGAASEPPNMKQVQAVWRNMQVNRGLRITDAVPGFNEEFRLDQDLLSPDVLHSLAFSISTTCSQFEQSQAVFQDHILDRLHSQRPRCSSSS
uniref:Ion transport domain-containing protein n=1 Tax=Rhizochromulina marina TaxID=1034831 RepID=A0A7S2WWN7_9STRA